MLQPLSDGSVLVWAPHSGSFRCLLVSWSLEARLCKMLTSSIRALARVAPRIPILSRLRSNFIILHYIYIISWIVVGSLIIYPWGENIKYIDALFLACNAATQGGLNTVDLNLLHGYQQATLWLVSILTNKILIHSLLVLVRLHLFEKRSYYVIQDATTASRFRASSETEATASKQYGSERGESIISEDNITAYVGTGNNRQEEEGRAEPPDVGRGGEGFRPELRSTRRVGAVHDSKIIDNHELEDGDDDYHNYDYRSSRPFESNSSRLSSPALTMSLAAYRSGFEESQSIPCPGNDDRRHLSEDSSNEKSGGDPGSFRQSGARGTQQTCIRHWFGSFDGRSQRISEEQDNAIEEAELGLGTERNLLLQAETRRMLPDVWEDDRGPTSSLLFSKDWLQRMADRLRSRRRRHEDNNKPSPYLDPDTAGVSSAADPSETETRSIEYRASTTLFSILISYYLLSHLSGVILLALWINSDAKHGSILEAAGVGRTWWSVFTASSAFQNLGLTLTPDSMISFQDAAFPIAVMTFLMIIGNTGFPCILRFIIWMLSKIVPRTSLLREELQFLLDYPRQCFALLFPRRATWWLFGILALLNGMDMALFLLLDRDNQKTKPLSRGVWIVDALFQVTATRTAGFSILPLSRLHPAMQVSFLAMMYVSVFPTAISMRETDIYEEISPGIYIDDDDDEEEEDFGSNNDNHSGRVESREWSVAGTTHMHQHQLVFDFCYISLGLFTIALNEGARLRHRKEEPSFNLFSVLFEIVSAYGTVGLSLGYPGTETSFSAQLGTFSKLVIIAIRIRGRHRGLPYELDRAVLFPSGWHETEEGFAPESTVSARRRDSNISRVYI